MKILFIDDEPELLDLIPQYITDHTWTQAESLSAAWECLQKEKYDAVIVDFLPNLESLKIIEQCRILNTECILFTGNFDLITLPVPYVIIKPDLDRLSLILNKIESKLKDVK